jgi:hypothetical protein
MKRHQRREALRLVSLAWADIKGQRVAFGVRAEVDFGREAAARVAERFLFLIPPFTPAACWWARPTVESMACSSSAGGPRLSSVSNAASNTPSLLQRVKRTKTEFQLPYRFGMSRHGAPVRRTQRIPLTVRRFALDRRPALAPVGEQGIEKAPFRVRQIAPTKRLPPSVKAALESFIDEETVNTA